MSQTCPSGERDCRLVVGHTEIPAGTISSSMPILLAQPPHSETQTSILGRVIAASTLGEGDARDRRGGSPPS